MTDPDHKPERVYAEPMPCPFCGGGSLAHRVPTGWRVSCKNCDCQPRPGLPPDTETEAIAVWNRRAHPQAPASEIGGEEQCFLCAGKCRGHGLGDASEWQPEPGSRAALAAVTAALTEALQLIEDGEGDADVIARQTLAQLGLPTLAQPNPGDHNDR